jgi:catechol 2,3-dioxygenase-like lactoylglutathione lyase family enzyme
MILGLHHPALAVPDMQTALDFYCGVLGFRVVMEAELPSGWDPMARALGLADSACKIRMLRKGNSCIEFFEFKEREAGDPLRPVNRTGISHIALATDDFDADHAVLLAAGVPFNTQPFGEAPHRFAYGRDPFGNVIELLEHMGGNRMSLDFSE